MDHGFRFREGTFDDWVFRSVVEENEYSLPERFEPDDVILDVGMHIGSFCHAAALRGAVESSASRPTRATSHVPGRTSGSTARP